MVLKSSPPNAEYVPKECGWCGGLGTERLQESYLCKPCDGQGYVYVAKPPKRCPHCHGSGDIAAGADKTTEQQCRACAGTGWSLRYLPPRK